jgi:hypothetical protein
VGRCDAVTEGSSWPRGRDRCTDRQLCVGPVGRRPDRVELGRVDLECRKVGWIKRRLARASVCVVEPVPRRSAAAGRRRTARPHAERCRPRLFRRARGTAPMGRTGHLASRATGACRTPAQGRPECPNWAHPAHQADSAELRGRRAAAMRVGSWSVFSREPLPGGLFGHAEGLADLCPRLACVAAVSDEFLDLVIDLGCSVREDDK